MWPPRAQRAQYIRRRTVLAAPGITEGLRRVDFIEGVRPPGDADARGDASRGRDAARDAVLPPAPVVDEFTTTSTAARPYISEFYFVYSCVLTLPRSVLILNGVSGYGRRVWAGSR